VEEQCFTHKLFRVLILLDDEIDLESRENKVLR